MNSAWRDEKIAASDLGILGLSAWANAGTPPPYLATARFARAPTPLEEQMLERIALGGVQAPSLDATLVLGGVRDATELSAARWRYHWIADPIVKEVAGSPPAIAAQLILRRLHLPSYGAPPPMVEYVAEATSLVDVLETGRFNCVSSALLYLLIATDAGLRVQPDFLHGHVRVRMQLRRREVNIEPGGWWGYDSSDFLLYDSCANRIDPAACGIDSIRISAGQVGTFPALLAAVYHNAANARMSDDPGTAVALLERASRLARGKPIPEEPQPVTIGTATARPSRGGDPPPWSTGGTETSEFQLTPPTMKIAGP